MASGDRIELLTADTFSSAMSTVAQESTVETVNTNVATANTNINSIKSTVATINTNVNTVKTSVGTASTAPSVTTAGGVVNTANTIQQKLQGISQYQIGATNSTGGSATAGNVMAKLNALINTVNNINTSVGTSLHSTIFIPSGNLLKTVVGSPIAINQATMVGCFVAKYSGCVQAQVTISSGTSKYTNSSGNFQIYVNPKYSMDKAAAIYPSMTFPKTVSLSDFTLDWNPSCTIPTLPTTVTSYIHVKAGDAVYFVLNSTGTDYYITCSNLSIYGSTISYY